MKHDILTKVNRLFRINRFKEQMPDQDGQYNKQIVPQDNAMVIWRISFFFLFTVAYATYRKRYDIAAVVFAVFLTSIEYWQHPSYSWMRNVDIVVVLFATVWITYRIAGSQYEKVCYLFGVLFILSYIVSWLVYDISIWLSTICHACVHIFSNMTAIVLCSGYIQPVALL